jgi:cob(I)alamin adenosyltransferase
MPRKSIVTRTGDSGETGLLYGGRVKKDDPRTEAYGTIDEAISALGLARALVSDRPAKAILLRLQEELFTVGAELATDVEEYATLEKHFKVITVEHTAQLEKEIDALEGRVSLPPAFVVPGESASSAALDVARAAVRRAERRIVALKNSGMLHNPEVLRYVNRLSDLLFMLARAEDGRRIRPLRGRRAPARGPVSGRPRPAPR